MKAIGKFIGGLWVVAFLAYMATTLYRASGNALPEVIERYRGLFERGIDEFLSSWMFGVVFVMGWLFVSYQLGKESGWQKLAKYYKNPRGGVPTSLKFYLGSGRVGKVGYSNCLKISGYRLGLAIKMMLLFRFGNSNLYIPWDRIDKITLRKTTSPEKKLGIIDHLTKRLSRSLYAHIQLIDYPDQVLVVPWNDQMEKTVPETLNLERERDLS